LGSFIKDIKRSLGTGVMRYDEPLLREIFKGFRHHLDGFHSIIHGRNCWFLCAVLKMPKIILVAVH